MGNPWAPPEDTQPGGRPPGQPSGGPHPDAPGPAPAGSPGRPPAAHPPHAAPPAPRPPHVGPPAPRPLPPPDPEGVARATRTSAWTAGVLLLSVLAVSLPWPAMLAAPVAAVAAVVLAILALVRAVRARARGSALVMPVVLVMSSLLWVGLSTTPLLYVDASRAYARCTAGAITEQAKRACTTQLEIDTRERLEELFSRVGAPPRD